MNWWKGGAYTLAIREEIVVSVTHKQTKVTKDISGFGMDKTFVFTDGWSDFGAALVKKPLPPARLCNFFAKKTKEGPWSQDCAISKSKAFEKFVASIHESWQQERMEASGSSHDKAAQEAKAQLQEITAERKRNNSKVAREKAEEALASRKAKRTIKLAE